MALRTLRLGVPAIESAITGTELEIRTMECSGIDVPNTSLNNREENAPAFNDTVVVARILPDVSVA